MNGVLSLESTVNSPSAARLLRNVSAAVDNLVPAFVRMQDDFAANGLEAPTELRSVQPMRIHEAALRCEVTVYDVTVHEDGVYSAKLAVKVVETELGYNVTTDDRPRLLAGLRCLYPSAEEAVAEGREDALCFSLCGHDFG